MDMSSHPPLRPNKLPQKLDMQILRLHALRSAKTWTHALILKGKVQRTNIATLLASLMAKT